jgi:hypothetical protein
MDDVHADGRVVRHGVIRKFRQADFCRPKIRHFTKIYKKRMRNAT